MPVGRTRPERIKEYHRRRVINDCRLPITGMSLRLHRRGHEGNWVDPTSWIHRLVITSVSSIVTVTVIATCRLAESAVDATANELRPTTVMATVRRCRQIQSWATRMPLLLLSTMTTTMSAHPLGRNTGSDAAAIPRRRRIACTIPNHRHSSMIHQKIRHQDPGCVLPDARMLPIQSAACLRTNPPTRTKIPSEIRQDTVRRHLASTDPKSRSCPTFRRRKNWELTKLQIHRADLGIARSARRNRATDPNDNARLRSPTMMCKIRPQDRAVGMCERKTTVR
mmetsp:Transcript_15894/g.44549  ORF Transcript_15894/g.44549 Transcript_15894/m.44549 type:complete len:281 (+) Transcript_15894:710-1552(+)